ncbi:MAG: acyltransferase [Alphaproteobacteria bacterium]|nr:MAG: acyltransferase [Alphaproteobacteria bacterium]
MPVERGPSGGECEAGFTRCLRGHHGERRLERHNNFDLLRLLAALSVIFSHAFLLAENSQDHDPLMILTGGQAILGLAGVFVFFTISGYLISQSFEATPSPFVFLAKRALRIFPGLFGCLIVCVFSIGPLVTNLPLSEYLAKPETWLFLLHNAVLDIGCPASCSGRAISAASSTARSGACPARHCSI